MMRNTSQSLASNPDRWVKRRIVARITTEECVKLMERLVYIDRDESLYSAITDAAAILCDLDQPEEEPGTACRHILDLCVEVRYV